MNEVDVGHSLNRAFAQPLGQNIPADFLKMLADLDRLHREPTPLDERPRRNG